MRLNEFFGHAIKLGNKKLGNDDKTAEYQDDLFWYILDHDRLHKDYFLPLARKIKNRHDNNNIDKTQCIKEFMPMVEKGCMEYYNKNQMKGRLGKVFSKKIREGLCEKLFDHYYEDIIKDRYKLGY